MSMESKALFLMDLEKRLGELITAVELVKVLSVVADQMQGYMIMKKETEDVKEDDLLNAYLSALRVRGLSEGTIKLYDLRIRQ